MTATGYLAGLLRVAALVLPVAYASHGMRTRLTRLAGPPGVLADLVIGLSLVVVVAEVLGSVAELRAAPLIGTAVGVALAVGLSSRGRAPIARSDPPIAPGWRAASPPAIAAVLAVAIVAAQWALETAKSLDAGIGSFDSLWYHMPFAAGFAQTASVTGVQYTQTDPLVAFFPANSELVHAVLMVVLHSDVASPVLNLGWLAVALLGGWCLGRPWGAGPATLAAVALVLATPVMGISQPGQGSNDIVALASFLAAAALVVRPAYASGTAAGELAVAGLAAGLAVGTKVTLLVPVLALGVCAVALAPVARRLVTALAVAGGAVVTGSCWYLRNLVKIGNPFGVLGVHLGPLDLAAPASPLERVFHYSLLTHIGDTGRWASRIAPGLLQALGPVWWALGPAAALGAVAAVSTRYGDRRARLLGLTAIVAAVGYAALPTSASFLVTNAQTFGFNTRYATPAVALGLASVALLAPLRPDRRAGRWLAPAIVVAIAVTQLAGSLWPDKPGHHAEALLIALGAVGALAAAASRGRPRQRPPTTVLVAVLGLGLAATAAGGYVVERDYLRNRYESYTHDLALAGIFRWAQPLRDARIAVAGTVLSYPLYGRDLSNRVTYLGHPGPHGGFGPILDCAEWRAGLARGRFDYVVVTPTNLVTRRASPELAWTRDDPSVSVALDAGGGDTVLRIDGPLHACARPRDRSPGAHPARAPGGPRAVQPRPGPGVRSS